MFRMNRWEFVKWAYLMLKTWTANRHSTEKYSSINAAEAWRPLLKSTAFTTWRACFGPWVGSDWSRVCLHTTGDFFRKQLITRPTHQHRADEDGPAWTHGAGNTSQHSMPPQITPLANLFLAGALTRTQAHVWSIEGAVESGRRAAKAIEPRVAEIDQYIPGWVRIISKIDDVFYAVKAPHVIDLTIALLLFLGLWSLF